MIWFIVGLIVGKLGSGFVVGLFCGRRIEDLEHQNERMTRVMKERQLISLLQELGVEQ